MTPELIQAWKAYTQDLAETNKQYLGFIEVGEDPSFEGFMEYLVYQSEREAEQILDKLAGVGEENV